MIRPVDEAGYYMVAGTRNILDFPDCYSNISYGNEIARYNGNTEEARFYKKPKVNRSLYYNDETQYELVAPFTSTEVKYDFTVLQTYSKYSISLTANSDSNVDNYIKVTLNGTPPGLTNKEAYPSIVGGSSAMTVTVSENSTSTIKLTPGCVYKIEHYEGSSVKHTVYCAKFYGWTGTFWRKENFNFFGDSNVSSAMERAAAFEERGIKSDGTAMDEYIFFSEGGYKEVNVSKPGTGFVSPAFYYLPYVSGILTDKVNQTSLSYSGCLTKDTLITLYNGTKKRVSELKMDDILLVYNFRNGKFEPQYPLEITTNNKSTTVTKILLENGKTIKIVGLHCFYDPINKTILEISKGKFKKNKDESFRELLDEEIYFADCTNNKITPSKILSLDVLDEYEEGWYLATSGTSSYIADDSISIFSYYNEAGFTDDNKFISEKISYLDSKISNYTFEKFVEKVENPEAFNKYYYYGNNYNYIFEIDSLNKNLSLEKFDNLFSYFSIEENNKIKELNVAFLDKEISKIKYERDKKMILPDAGLGYRWRDVSTNKLYRSKTEYEVIYPTVFVKEKI